MPTSSSSGESPVVRRWRRLARDYGLFLLALLVAVLFVDWFIRGSTIPNFLKDDQFRLAGYVLEKAYDGTLELRDLWRPHAGHRTPGLHLHVLLNARLFHYSTRVEMLTGIAALALMALVLFQRFRTTVSARPGPLVAQIAFLPLLALLFSLGQRATLNYGHTMAWAVPRLAIFTLTLYCLDRALIERGHYRWIALALLPFSVLIYGGGYGVCLVAVVVVLVGAAVLLAGPERRAMSRWGLAAVLVSLGSLMLYLLGGGLAGDRSRSVDTLGLLLKQPGDTLQFFSFGFARSVVDTNWMRRNLEVDDRVLVLAGLLVIASTLFAGFLFFRRRVYRRTWLPLALILFTYVVLGAVALTRFEYFGLRGALFPRYVYMTKSATVGVVWIAVDWLLRAARQPLGEAGSRGRRIVSAGAVAVLLAVLASQVHLTAVAVRAMPYTKRHYQRFREIAVRGIDNLRENEHRPFYRPQTRRFVEVMKFLEENDLNIYHQLRLEREAEARRDVAPASRPPGATTP